MKHPRESVQRIFSLHGCSCVCLESSREACSVIKWLKAFNRHLWSEQTSMDGFVALRSISFHRFSINLKVLEKVFWRISLKGSMRTLNAYNQLECHDTTNLFQKMQRLCVLPTLRKRVCLMQNNPMQFLFGEFLLTCHQKQSTVLLSADIF